jgi:hypothetical protein
MSSFTHPPAAAYRYKYRLLDISLAVVLVVLYPYTPENATGHQVKQIPSSVPSNVDTIWNNQIAIGKDHQSIQREKEKK